MSFFTRKSRFIVRSILRHDIRASITVFFVALPLCLGISLASNTPVYSGLAAGIIGGIVVSLISGSQLSVSGPAAGLTAICAAAITELGSVEIFFLSVAVAGFLQILLGVFKLGGFTHFIPSSVIKGMLAAIGIILISKQIPLLIGYDKPDFWTNELFNVLTFSHGFQNLDRLYHVITAGPILIAVLSYLVLYLWNRFSPKKLQFLPSSFIVVVAGVLLAILLKKIYPSIQLSASQFVQVPENILAGVNFPDLRNLFSNNLIWKNATIICFVATLETLLSIEAIDKLDPYNRITPQNRELVAQGTGNIVSGLAGGLPITAVIVRSSANAEAGGKTRASAMFHGIWLLLTVIFAVRFINLIPYSVLAIILIRTGYNLAKPAMFKAVYKQGKEQFAPFIFTVAAILFTDLLIGVVIGFIYSVYFLIKHTYRAGYTMNKKTIGNQPYYSIELAMNVSFLNKKRILEMLDNVPEYAIVDINASKSIYIDHDILEILHDFKSKAHKKHIEIKMNNIPDVETIEIH